MGGHSDATPNEGDESPNAGESESTDAIGEGKSTTETEADAGTSRRTLLRAVGGASALAGAGAGVGAGGGSGIGGLAGRGAAQADRTTILLGARRDYWVGLQPRAIEGQQNPRLQLREGDPYRVVWINLDGERHRFRLLDSDGTVVGQTRPSGEQGATRATRFRARPELAAYECQFHPEEMRASVEFGEGFPTTQAGETTTEGPQTTEGRETTTTEQTTNGGGSGNVVEVAVGPEGNYFRFVPERVEIPVGGTVRWRFESAGHNVSARPEAARQVSLPEGAEPFSSYPEGESYRVVPEGETYEHTFEVPGEYVYVCLPHVGEGMIGTVVVSG